MKKAKTIFDVKSGDSVWIVIPGILNRFNDGIVLFPSILKAKVRTVSCVDRGEKGTSVVEIIIPDDKKFPFTVPSSFFINHDTDDPNFEIAVEHSRYVEDPYMDIDVSYVKISCIFDTSLAKREFKKISKNIEGRLVKFIQSEKKRIANTRKTVKAIRENLERNFGKMKYHMKYQTNS